MAEVPIDPMLFLEPIAELIRPILSTLSVLIGGVFGLYLLLVLIRVYYERKKVKLLVQIQRDLAAMRESEGIRLEQQEPLIHKAIDTIFAQKKQPGQKSTRKRTK